MDVDEPRKPHVGFLEQYTDAPECQRLPKVARKWDVYASEVIAQVVDDKMHSALYERVYPTMLDRTIRWDAALGRYCLMLVQDLHKYTKRSRAREAICYLITLFILRLERVAPEAAADTLLAPKGSRWDTVTAQRRTQEAATMARLSGHINALWAWMTADGEDPSTLDCYSVERLREVREAFAREVDCVNCHWREAAAHPEQESDAPPRVGRS